VVKNNGSLKDAAKEIAKQYILLNREEENI
jgi:hypothetical protein